MANQQIVNRTIFTGDNLDVLRGMNSNSFPLIYLDPPFNSNSDYSAPVGSAAAGAAFKDTWHLSDTDWAEHGLLADSHPSAYDVIRAAKSAHSDSMMSYLIMMGVRLIEMRRVLTEDGSIFVHVDPTAGHWVKSLMDAVFGAKSFQNDIIWSYRKMPNNAQHYQRNHDIILFYAREGHVWNRQFEDYV